MDEKMVQDITRLLPVFDRDGYSVKGKVHHWVWYGYNEYKLICIKYHIVTAYHHKAIAINNGSA